MTSALLFDTLYLVNIADIKKSVLVVDDSPTFLMYTALLLKRMGFEVIPVGSGKEAVRLTRLMLPDAVMLNVHLPEFDGFKTLESLKADKRISRIPVIMVSVDSSEETIQKCKGIGCADYLTKPLKIDRLHESLQNCLFMNSGRPRKHLRALLNERVTISCDGYCHDFYTENLSEKGMYLRGRNPLPVGSEVKVELPVKNAGKLSLNGTVIYTKSLSPGHPFKIPIGMAVEFKDMASGDSEMLREYVAEAIAGDLLKSQEEPILDITDDNL